MLASYTCMISARLVPDFLEVGFSHHDIFPIEIFPERHFPADFPNHKKEPFQSAASAPSFPLRGCRRASESSWDDSHPPQRQSFEPKKSERWLEEKMRKDEKARSRKSGGGLFCFVFVEWGSKGVFLVRFLDVFVLFFHQGEKDLCFWSLGSFCAVVLCLILISRSVEGLENDYRRSYPVRWACESQDCLIHRNLEPQKQWLSCLFTKLYYCPYFGKDLSMRLRSSPCTGLVWSGSDHLNKDFRRSWEWPILRML